MGDWLEWNLLPADIRDVQAHRRFLPAAEDTLSAHYAVGIAFNGACSCASQESGSSPFPLSLSVCMCVSAQKKTEK